ncbi:MAG TPA: hypothetical protein VIO61_15830 [Anaerolineaceae bacterium]
MTKLSKLTLFIVVLLSTLMLVSCNAPVNYNGGRVVLGQNLTIEKGEKVNGDLIVSGGSLILRENSTVDGDVVVFGGNIVVDGTVNGSIFATGGNISLGDTAVVGEDVNVIGGNLTKSEKARVGGSIGNNAPPSRVEIPKIQVPSAPRVNWNPGNWIDLRPINTVLTTVLNSLAIGLIALLAALFLVRPMERVSRSVVASPIVIGGIGLLTLIVVPALLLILLITIILSPISLLGILVFGLAFVFGWISIGLLLGRKIAETIKVQWADAVSAGIGTVALSLASSIATLIPCIGWVVPFLVLIVGLGAVVATRFGTQEYSDTSHPAPVPPVAPVPPAPPVPPAGQQVVQAAPYTPPAPAYFNPNIPAEPEIPSTPPASPDQQEPENPLNN